jgi:hypothetical protein
MIPLSIVDSILHAGILDEFGGLFGFNLWTVGFLFSAMINLLLIVIILGQRSNPLVKIYDEVKKSRGLKKLLLIYDGLGNYHLTSGDVGVGFIKSKPVGEIDFGSYELDEDAFMNFHNVGLALIHSNLKMTLHPDIPLLAESNIKDGDRMRDIIDMPNIVEYAKCYNTFEQETNIVDAEGNPVLYKTGKNAGKQKTETKKYVCGYAWELPREETKTRIERIRQIPYNMMKIPTQVGNKILRVKENEENIGPEKLTCPACREYSREIKVEPEIIETKKRVVELKSNTYLMLSYLKDWVFKLKSNQTIDIRIEKAKMNERKQAGWDGGFNPVTIFWFGLGLIFVIVAIGIWRQNSADYCRSVYQSMAQAGVSM